MVVNLYAGLWEDIDNQLKHLLSVLARCMALMYRAAGCMSYACQL